MLEEFNIQSKSPFSRREWIEICLNDGSRNIQLCLPSHEGSGLKCKGWKAKRVAVGLPSHEGSGLKYPEELMWADGGFVSLLTKGVD